MSPISILVHYIDKKHNKLGVDDQVIDTLCRKTLVLATCKSTKFQNERTILKTTILRRGDYGKDICLFDHQQTITLYGVPHVVKDVQQRFESIDKKDEKINDVSLVVKSAPNKPETSPIANRRDLNIENPSKSGESNTRQKNSEIVQTRSIMFYVDEPGFEVLVNQNFNRLSAIVESKCLLEKQIIHHQIQIQIPKAKVYEFDDNASEVQSQDDNSEPSNNSDEASANSKKHWFLKLFQRDKPKTQSPKPIQQQSPIPQVQSTSSADTTASVTVGNSKIIVCTGDLTKQAVSFFPPVRIKMVITMKSHCEQAFWMN
jgi:hypothetical protein